MAASKRKPRGWQKFDELARKLAKVPKSEVDAAVEASKRKRRKK